MNRPAYLLSSSAVGAILGAALCVTPAFSQGQLPPGFPAGWSLLERTVAETATSGMVVSGSPIASAVGAEILKRGGNAVDAAVAVGFALAVVHPEAGNLGGGGYMVIRLADGTVSTLDYRETAPGRASRNMYLDEQGRVTDRSVIGHLAAGVPGSVAGMFEAHRRYGSLPWRDLVQPAVRLAKEGFVIDEFRSRSIASSARKLAQFPASRSQFLPNGEAPKPGTLFQQPDLAATLQAIADSGAPVFYRGYIADLIVAEMERGGGIISKEDLAGYRPIWRDPVVIRYRGHTIYSMPPSSSGGVTLAEILNILEGYDPLPPFGAAESVHLKAEAMRRAFIDRNRYLGDPAFVSMPLDRLLSKEYAATLRSDIDPQKASKTPAFVSSGSEGTNTTHYSIVDSRGNAVSVTTTINSSYGSGVTVTGAGFLLNNEMDDFAAAPGRPNQYGLVQGEANAIAPGKRMLSAMTPSIVLDPQGRLRMVLGTPGGPTIITSVAQVILNVIDHGMTLAEAVAAPRIHHQAWPDQIFYERGGLSDAVVETLRSWGHTVEERSGYSGDIAAIEWRGGRWIGVADPRRGGGAAGY
ncbi:MAG: gamma-glutamyltransferase [Gemmatimonadales bacterium]|nr:MAG: gamma-glutamyltransferase [Gemmatimonadales bacterium]